MTIVLFLLMGYRFFSQQAHEWIGITMFILFVIHHILNKNWHKNILKGKYQFNRIFFLIVDVVIFICMLAQMYSGIAMAQHTISIPTTMSMSIIRRLHILGAYWGFIFLSIHLGLHWKLIISKLNIYKRANNKKNINNIINVLAFIIAIYGVIAFVNRDFSAYLLLKKEFVFLNYNELAFLFYIDYFSIMGLFIFITHYGRNLIKSKINID